MIGASAAQRGLLYALAAKCGEGHPHIKDRAAAIGLLSIADMTQKQAHFLIREYQSLLTPPAAIQPTRANFFALPKRVLKPAAPPTRPATPVSAAPIKPAPARKEPVGANKFDPDLVFARGDGIEDIPW